MKPQALPTNTTWSWQRTRFLAPKIYAYQSCRGKLSRASFFSHILVHNVEQLGNGTSQLTKVLMASVCCFILVLCSLQGRTHAVASDRCMRWNGRKEREGEGQSFHLGSGSIRWGPAPATWAIACGTVKGQRVWAGQIAVACRSPKGRRSFGAKLAI